MPAILSKRGRPKASMLPYLILEGKQVQSNMKCKFCHRNFPRIKSLRTHVTIHTNEKPFECTYPGCDKFFRQSGQLKNHIRRHTGEKPFTCPETGCTQRYIHSSRKCPKHKKRCFLKDGREEVVITDRHSREEIMWLEEYKEKQKEDKVKRKRETMKNKAKEFKYDDASSSSSLSETSDDFPTDYSPEIMNSGWGSSAIRINGFNEDDLKAANMLLFLQATGRGN